MRPSRLLCALGAGAVIGTALAQPPAQPDAAARDYLSANGLLARGMNELAEKDYRRFLEEHADHARAPQARYGLAVALFRQQKFEPALAELEQVRKSEGFEFAAEAGVLSGQCLMALERYADAAAPLARVVERNGSHDLADDAAALLVETRERAGQHAEALAARKLLEERWPDSPVRDRAEYFASLALIAQGKPAEAAERLGAIGKKWPKSPLAERSALLAAQSAQRAGDTAAAERAYQGLIDGGDPRQAPPALLGLAVLKQGAAKPEEAKALLDRLLSEFPKSEQATRGALERGRALLDLGKPEQALKDFDTYASTPKADALEADFWKARCEARLKKPREAAERLKAALARAGAPAEGTPPDRDLRPLARLDLASALIASGKDEEGAAVLEQFRAELESHPLRAEATEALATLRHRRGEYAPSAQLCDEFRARYPKHALRARIDFVTAENAFLTGEMPRAIREYKAFLAEHPSDASAPVAKFRLGCAYYRNGSTDKARPFLEEAAAKASSEAALRPSLLYLGDMALQAGDWAKAEERLRAFVALGQDQPGMDDALLKLGMALARQGRHEQALAELRKVAETTQSPAAAPASLEMGRSLVALGKKDEARERFAALGRGKDKRTAAAALMQLGALESGEGRHTEAAAAFRGAAGAGGEQGGAEALMSLGSSLMAAGDLKGAADAFERLAREYGQHALAGEARARLALARARLSATADSLAALDATFAAKDLPADLREALAYEKGVCLRKLGRTDEADAAMKAVASTAKDPAVRVYAAVEASRSQLEAKKFDDAAATLRAVSADLADSKLPGDLRESAEYQLAACEYQLGHHRQGAELFEKFLDQHPDSPLAGSAALLAGECRRQLKQPQRAVALLKKASEAKLSEPDQQAALLKLGECLAETQDWKASEEAFTKFLERFDKSDLWFQARFGRAWALENQSRHDDAIAEYRKVAAGHQGPTAARAQFQIGECLFAQGRHDQAASELLKVDILYAYPEWSAAALYEAGRCLDAMGKAAEARAQYEQVTQKHADTRWAKLAAERLSAPPKPTAAPPVPERGR